MFCLFFFSFLSCFILFIYSFMKFFLECLISILLKHCVINILVHSLTLTFIDQCIIPTTVHTDTLKVSWVSFNYIRIWYKRRDLKSRSDHRLSLVQILHAALFPQFCHSPTLFLIYTACVTSFYTCTPDGKVDGYLSDFLINAAFLLSKSLWNSYSIYKKIR